MASDDTDTDASRRTDAESTFGRRQFGQLATGALAIGLAGCSGLPTGTGDDGGASGGDPTATDAPAETDEPTGTDELTGTDEPTGTDEETPTETESTGADEESDDGNTDGELHEHGTLYFEIDGQRVDFSRPKFFAEGDHPDARATDRFHFHDDDHQYMWHMHDERLTLSAALNLLPDISYETNGGATVVRFEGDSYEDGQGDTRIEFRERDRTIDPDTYELQGQDIIWVEIFTDGD